MKARRLLAVLLALLAIAIQIAKFSGVNLETTLLVENGYPTGAKGYNVTLLLDYKLCYSSPFVPQNASISIPLEEGEVRGLLREEGCLDLPPGMNFGLPIIFLSAPMVNIPLKEVFAREPGILQANYEGLGTRLSLLITLVLEEVKVEVRGEGSYRLKVTMLRGSSPAGERELACSDACAFEERPREVVTAYNVLVVREKIPSYLLDLASLVLLLSLLFIAVPAGRRLIPLR
ncbi:MAG: hypothetical protein N3F67_00445 [Acidilobaceae archaeon]|nr:hypothetical protein [Acidilobaceae archaeon]